MTVWVAKGDSAHFVFEAYGATRDEALAAYRKLIEAHAREYPGAELSWAREMVEDVSVSQVETGHGYRDGRRVV